MLGILDVWIDTKWDQRRWELALLSDKPVETYQQMAQQAKDDKNTPVIDELSEAEKAWLRNTG
jgi:hypothetical protein